VRLHLSNGVFRSLLARLLHDEHGAELLEYVLIAGLIVAAVVATLASFGTKVLARWTSINASM
jgi:Flp pilus assembly pilin Flp